VDTSRGNRHLAGIHRTTDNDREEHDFYATHPSAIPPLINLLQWQDGGKLIRENSCGQGHLSKAIERYGHTVISTDLVDRGYGITGVDYLEHHWTDDFNYDAVIMNPPYKYAQEFVEKSLKIAPVVAVFLRIQWLETEKRRKLFEEYPPKYVAVFSKRIPSSKNAMFKKEDGTKESSAVCYAWFIWVRGNKEDPVLKWI
jgi:hypothetical protein